MAKRVQKLLEQNDLHLLIHDCDHSFTHTEIRVHLIYFLHFLLFLFLSSVVVTELSACRRSSFVCRPIYNTAIQCTTTQPY